MWYITNDWKTIWQFYFWDHFGDGWNCLDLLVYIMIIVTTIGYISGMGKQVIIFVLWHIFHIVYKSLQIVASVSVLLATFDILYFLRGSTELSLVLGVMSSIFINIWSFLLILGILVTDMFICNFTVNWMNIVSCWVSLWFFILWILIHLHSSKHFCSLLEWEF